MTRGEIWTVSAAGYAGKPRPAVINVSRVMVDKITTVSRKRLGERIGRLEGAQMMRLNRAIPVFLGLA